MYCPNKVGEIKESPNIKSGKNNRGVKVIVICAIATKMVNLKYFRVINPIPIKLSRIAKRIKHTSGDIKLKQILQTVVDPICSAGLILGKNFKIPK